VTLPERIKRIAVIDDDPRAREAYAESITDACFIPFIQGERLQSIDELVQILKLNADAAVCDQRLAPGNYASFLGAEAVAALYSEHYPAILITQYADADLDIIRLHRRKIPSMLPSGGLDEDAIKMGLAKCLGEFKDLYVKERRPWRTLLRVTEIDQKHAYVIVPSWDPKSSVKLPLGVFGSCIALVRPGVRLFARVNIGADKNEDLFFDQFEIAEKPVDY
jgi:hypothetical protein